MSVTYTVTRTASPSVVAGRVADRGEVLQAAAGLLGGGGADELAGPRVERDLARAEQQPAGAHGVDVGPDRLGGIRRCDRLAVVRTTALLRGLVSVSPAKRIARVHPSG